MRDLLFERQMLDLRTAPPTSLERPSSPELSPLDIAMRGVKDPRSLTPRQIKAACTAFLALTEEAEDDEVPHP